MESPQHIETPKSIGLTAEPTVKPTSKFKELPFWKRGITLATVGLSALAASCGDSTGNESTTTIPPTTIEPTTTLPQKTTTTTKAPTTTTLTTVPETPTTTEPIDLSLPTGEMTQLVETSPGKFSVKDLAPGEIYFVEQDGSGSAEYTRFSVTIIDFYNDFYRDVNGNDQTVAYLKVFVKNDTQGNPLIIRVALNNSENSYIGRILYSSSNVENDDNRGWDSLENLRSEIDNRKHNNSQIGISIISSYTQQFVNMIDDYCSADSQSSTRPYWESYCKLIPESLENFDNGAQLIDILNKPELTPEDRALLNGSLIWARELSLFPIEPRD